MPEKTQYKEKLHTNFWFFFQDLHLRSFDLMHEEEQSPLISSRAETKRNYEKLRFRLNLKFLSLSLRTESASNVGICSKRRYLYACFDPG